MLIAPLFVVAAVPEIAVAEIEKLITSLREAETRIVMQLAYELHDAMRVPVGGYTNEFPRTLEGLVIVYCPNYSLQPTSPDPSKAPKVYK